MTDDFVLNGEDYVDLIQNDEDLKKFNRMRELDPILKGNDWHNIVPEIEEYINLDNKLKGKPPIRIVLFDGSKIQNN